MNKRKKEVINFGEFTREGKAFRALVLYRGGYDCSQRLIFYGAGCNPASNAYFSIASA